MRGAGCTYNDIVDRDYDAASRARAAGPFRRARSRVRGGLGVPGRAVPAGLPGADAVQLVHDRAGRQSLLLIAIYPFMKRFTFWPQLVLGLTFKWGALVGWAAVTGSLSLAAVVLYAGCVLWTVGYDTIYAHQDKEDDALLGLKSTALGSARRRRAGSCCSTRARSRCGRGRRARRRRHRRRRGA